MDPRDYDQALLQAYRARLPKRATDAEFIDDDVYADYGDRSDEEEPMGLVDRLYRERREAQPMRGIGNPQSVPTTKNRYA